MQMRSRLSSQSSKGGGIMVPHTIEELHELFKNRKLSVKEYYKELFEELK